MSQVPEVPLSERRRTTRVDCCYQVHCGLESQKFDVSVINMGLGGMRIISEVRLLPEQLLQLSQPAGGFGQIGAEVVWSRPRVRGQDFEAGLVYRDDLLKMENSWVKAALQRLGFETSTLLERRRSPRFATSVGCQLYVKEQPSPCLMRDLGLGGALLRAEASIEGADEGTLVALEVGIGDRQLLNGRIVYARALEGNAMQYGLCFDTDQWTQQQARLVEGYLVSIRSDS